MDSSTSAQTRRTSLFGDQKSALNLWGFLSRESLLLLGHDYQTLLRRGKPVPTPAVPEPPKPKVEFNPKHVTPTPLLRQRVFKTTPESPGLAALDALASDGPIAKVVDAGADATRVPELFRSVETRVLSLPTGEEGKKTTNNTPGLSNRLNAQLTSLSHRLVMNIPVPLKNASGRLGRWWSKERLSKVVDASLPFRELDIVVLDGKHLHTHVSRSWNLTLF
jgi:nucleoporin NDC1